MPVVTLRKVGDSGIDYQWFANGNPEPNSGQLPWETVNRVSVYKRDMLIDDLICLQCEWSHGKVIEIAEDDALWQPLTESLAKHLCGCKPWTEWFTDVAFPAFEANQQVIYQRSI